MKHKIIHNRDDFVIQVKMSATRGLGNLLRLIKNEKLLRNTEIKTLCESAIMKLLDCACKVNNMKVRWNACYAMGSVMKNEQLFTCFSGWQVRLLDIFFCSSLKSYIQTLHTYIHTATALAVDRSHSLVPICSILLFWTFPDLKEILEQTQYKPSPNINLWMHILALKNLRFVKSVSCPSRHIRIIEWIWILLHDR